VRRYLRDPTFSRFDTILECDGHTHTDRQTDRHTTTAYTALSKASRGKNPSCVIGPSCIDKTLRATCTRYITFNSRQIAMDDADVYTNACDQHPTFINQLLTDNSKPHRIRIYTRRRRRRRAIDSRSCNLQDSHAR